MARVAPFAVEHLIDPVAPPNHELQVFGLAPLLFHAEFDGRHRVGWVDGGNAMASQASISVTIASKCAPASVSGSLSK